MHWKVYIIYLTAKNPLLPFLKKKQNKLRSSGSIHGHYAYPHVFPPNSIKGFWNISCNLHYFAPETGTGVKPCSMKRLGEGEGLMWRKDFVRGEKPPRPPWLYLSQGSTIRVSGVRTYAWAAGTYASLVSCVHGHVRTFIFRLDCKTSNSDLI